MSPGSGRALPARARGRRRRDQRARHRRRRRGRARAGAVCGDSGIGRAHGPFGLHEVVNVKYVFTDDGARRSVSPWHYPYDEDFSQFIRAAVPLLYRQRLRSRYRTLDDSRLHQAGSGSGSASWSCSRTRASCCSRAARDEAPGPLGVAGADGVPFAFQAVGGTFDFQLGGRVAVRYLWHPGHQTVDRPPIRLSRSVAPQRRQACPARP